LAGVDLVGVADQDPDQAASLAAAFEIPFHGGSASELLQKTDPDLVHVLTPPGTHEEIAVDALEQGRNVIIEKPFARSPGEVGRIMAAAERGKARVAAIHNYLSQPAVEELVERVTRGEIGELCSVHLMHGRRDQRYVPVPWYFDDFGGRLGETLPHAVYLVLALIPDLDVGYVCGRHLGHTRLPEGLSAKPEHVDDLRVELDAGDGRYATILYSLDCDLPQSLVATGTQGTLQAWICARGDVERWRAGTPTRSGVIHALQAYLRGLRLPLIKPKPRPRPSESPHGRQIARFIEHLRSDAPWPDQRIGDVVRLTTEIIDRYERSQPLSSRDSN
jgi:predicted dehydrogenase